MNRGNILTRNDLRFESFNAIGVRCGDPLDFRRSVALCLPNLPGQENVPLTRMLGRGLSMLVDVFNPERMIIGSIFGRCEDLLCASMEAELRREDIPFSLENLSIAPAKAGKAWTDRPSMNRSFRKLIVKVYAE